MMLPTCSANRAADSDIGGVYLGQPRAREGRG
ncbi:hypothetical protein BH23GEM8_BH23GEM8_04810 [soil metagenome]